MWKVCLFYSQNNKIAWLLNMGRHIFLRNSRGAQRHVGFFSWLCFSNADWLVRGTPVTWISSPSQTSVFQQRGPSPAGPREDAVCGPAAVGWDGPVPVEVPWVLGHDAHDCSHLVDPTLLSLWRAVGLFECPLGSHQQVSSRNKIIEVLP